MFDRGEGDIYDVHQQRRRRRGHLGSLCRVIRTWRSRKLVGGRFGSAFAEVVRRKAAAVARSLSETRLSASGSSAPQSQFDHPACAGSVRFLRRGAQTRRPPDEPAAFSDALAGTVPGAVSRTATTPLGCEPSPSHRTCITAAVRWRELPSPENSRSNPPKKQGLFPITMVGGGARNRGIMPCRGR